MENQNDFIKFLKQIGYNENGIRETINRIDQGRPDREDQAIYNRYKIKSRKETNLS